MKRSRLFLLIAVFAVFLLTNTAFAALDLGVDELTLDPGEFFEFTPQDGLVHWFVSDESVLELGGEESIGVRALEPGTAVVFAMTDDYLETDSCVVTVTGEAKAVKSASLYYQDLTEEDLAKVNDPALAAVLNIANNTADFPMGIGSLSGFDYKVLIAVKDGSQQKVADAAEAMGIEDTWAYEYISMVSLSGGANDIAKLLIDCRDDIVSVETDGKYSIDPVEEEEELESKGFSLWGNAAALSNFEAIHNLEFTGEGQYVAIVDTGIAPNHQEFMDDKGNSRIAYQHCYSSAASEGLTSYNGVSLYLKESPVCAEGATDAESAEPSNAVYKVNFDHGTHVAGIAAGRSGVAPDAKIIAVQAFTEAVYYYTNSDNTPQEYIYDKTAYIYYSEELKAMEFIWDLIENQGIEVAAVNMSYGGGAYSGYVNYYADIADLFSKFLQKGTVPCAASGNDSYTGYISAPAADRYTFAVGALDNSIKPVVATYSNHSKLVNILAPGTDVKSAMYTQNWGLKSGTSMATPMVSGAFALIRQMYPTATAAELENFLLKTTTKSASRGGITVPVLNFDHISEYYAEDPVIDSDYVVTNADKTVKVDLYKNTDFDGYRVTLCDEDENPLSSQYVSSAKNKTITFSGLTNDTEYWVKVASCIEINGSRYFSPVKDPYRVVPMAAPSGLTFDITEDSVTVTWVGHESDRIFVECTGDNGSFMPSGDAWGSFKVLGLGKGNPYSIRVRRYHEDLNYFSPWSAVTTFVALPKPVENTDYTVSGGNKTITVKLNKNASYDGYKVDLYTAAGKLVSSKTLAVKKTTSLTFSKLTNDSVYIVKAAGYKTSGKVKYYTNTVETKTAPMAAPTGLSLKTDAEADTVTASWPNYAGKQVMLRYKEGESGTYQTVESSTGSTVINLKKNTVYYFSFRWYNDGCELYSPWSAESSAMILSTPEKKDAEVGYKKIRVYFDDVNTLTGHQIKTYIKSSGKLVSTVNVKYSTNKTSADITKLTNNVEYKFEIRAYRTVGKTTYYSDPVTVYATPQLKPVDGDAPKNMYAYGGSKKITVGWSKDTWTTGHYIELYRLDNKVMVANAYVANKSSAYTFSGSKIDYDVPYLIRVWKYNEKSPKAICNSYVDTYAVSLATPGSFAASAGDGSIKVTWTYSGIADSVDVYWSNSSSGGYSLGCTEEGGAKTCTIGEGDLENGKLYYVKAAAAYTLEGQTVTSAYTAVKSVMPLPNSTATVTTDSKIVTVKYAKDSEADGHIIQLYKMKGTRASLVKTVTNFDKTDNVTVTFNKLSNGTTYRVTICSYKKIGRTTYRGAVTTYNNIVPNVSSSAMDITDVSDFGETFDGFVDPVDGLNDQAESNEVVETEVKKEDEQYSIFDMFRL